MIDTIVDVILELLLGCRLQLTSIELNDIKLIPFGLAASDDVIYVLWSKKYKRRGQLGWIRTPWLIWTDANSPKRKLSLNRTSHKLQLFLYQLLNLGVHPEGQFVLEPQLFMMKNHQQEECHPVISIALSIVFKSAITMCLLNLIPIVCGGNSSNVGSPAGTTDIIYIRGI